MSEIKEREQRAHQLQQQQQQQQDLSAQRSDDWQLWFRRSLYAALREPDNPIIGGLGEALSIERAARRKEVQHAVEEVKRTFDAKLEQLERRLKNVPGKLTAARTWQPVTVARNT